MTSRRHEARPLLENEEEDDLPYHNRRGMERNLLHLLGFNRAAGSSKLATTFIIGICVITVLLFTSIFLVARRDHTLSREWSAVSVARPIASAAYQDGMIKCHSIARRSDEGEPAPNERARNPRFEIGFKSTTNATNRATILKHATLWDGDGSLWKDIDIALHNGMVYKVQQDLSTQALAKELKLDVSLFDIIDVEGRYVTPGLVDMHSHVGVDSWPALRATDDTNEMTESPTLPQLRSLDGFNPHDPAIQTINSGGVTTSLILPGSGNLMGGEAYAIKHRKVETNSAEDMLLNAGMSNDDGKQWRWMKMACGENAKTFYGEKGMLPGSRLGEGWLFRKYFEAARDLLQQQDDWCTAAEAAENKYGKDAARFFVSGRFPEEQKYESLVALLRGDVRLNTHCYETYDLEMMVRHSHEFGFKITTFHHALEAWRVPELLVRENISVAIFADNWAYKKEAYDASVYDGVVLSDAGVEVAYKSDHPVLNAQHLIHEAAKAHHYGLSAELAIKSVTSVPATKLGAGHRIGQLKPGYDADAVIWDRHPLELGAHPLKVIVDGYETFSLPFGSKPAEPAPVTEELHGCSESASFTLKNIGNLYADENTALTNATIVVRDGVVHCMSESKCEDAGEVYDLGGGVVVPGGVAVQVGLGLKEIAAEEVTYDGFVQGLDPATGGNRAVDGLRVGNSKTLDATIHAGVTTAIAVPDASGVVLGQSVAFRTGATSYKDAVLKDVAALHVALGNEAKDGTPSASALSAQIGLLRRTLMTAIDNSTAQNCSDATENPWKRVIHGCIPLAIKVHEANDISKVISLKNEVEAAAHKFGNQGNISFTIVGGEEAWLVADDLAKAQIPVVLLPARCTPGVWESRRCRVPSSRPTAIEILIKAGVSVSLSDPENARNIFWEAGWALADATNDIVDLNEHQAVGFVTWNAADALGSGEVAGRISVGKTARFAAFNGSPLVLGPKPQLVVDGSLMLCHPKQA
ncbi:hypothetical protein HDU85_003994 [Gaertneriomyces sp. JEL0708]|nr:hypothetical protein HDU85_003994 [Gaertneriomyces sp. JEL0708]